MTDRLNSTLTVAKSKYRSFMVANSQSISFKDFFENMKFLAFKSLWHKTNSFGYDSMVTKAS